MDITVRIAQQPEADALLTRDSLAVMIGMLLDQQVPMEWAFTGPYTIAQRLGVSDLDAADIAAYDPNEFAALMSAKPAVHRYPGSMATRIQQLCQYLVDHYSADPASIWDGVGTGEELLRRLTALPGFGKQKSQIFVAMLGKQFHITPDGWRQAAGSYGDEGSYRSAADVTGPDSLQRVRTFKQEAKRKAKKDAPDS